MTANIQKGLEPMRHRRVDRKRLVRAIVIMLFIGVLVFAIVSSCLKLTERTIKIGLSESSRPLTFLDERKNISGFEADYARLIADKLGKKPDLKILEPKDMAEALDSGAIDCVISVRQSVHDYIKSAKETSPFISYGSVIIKSAGDESISGEEDLRGKRVGVIVNSDAENVCDILMDRLSFNVRKYDYEVQPFQDLKLKKNNAVIADEVFARFMQKEDKESYQVLDVIYDSADYGVRLSRKLSDQNARDIEDAIYGLHADIELSDIFLMWFGAVLN